MADTVTLRIPIDYAIQWDIDALVSLFAREAVKAGGELVDDSESEGESESFEFALTPDQVRDVAAKVVGRKRGVESIEVTGDREVRVVTKVLPWLCPIGTVEHPYDRALRRLCSKISQDPEWEAWRASTGYTRLEFQENHYTGPGSDGRPTELGDNHDRGSVFVRAGFDLSIIDDDHPPRGASMAAARRNLGQFLDDVSAHVGIPHPPLP